MIKDRGTIKWTAMMLPEHVQSLREIWENDQRIAKPILDEQELEEINLLIGEALERNLEVTISYYKSGYIHKTSGTIRTVNPNNQEIKLIDQNEQPSYIKFNTIVSVSIK